MSRSLHGLPPSRLAAFLMPAEPYLSCEDCFDLLDRYAESRALGTPSPVQGMDEHLASCPACAEEAQSLLHLIRHH